MKLARYAFIIMISALFSLQAFASEVLVLVPGFFNNFTPEYFSQDVIECFQNKGFKVYIPKNLNSIGTIEDNGARLESFFADIEKAEGSAVTFNVVAHSAGGFYTLYVANRNKFNIKNILTVSTPFKGIEFLQTWLDRSYTFSLLAELAYLDGLVQLTESGVHKFISGIRISPKTRVVAFGGYQDNSIDIWNARYLSAPLRVTSSYISEKSDGIVGYTSALAIGHILTTENKKALQFKDSNYFLALEHWEQVLDSSSFILLGIRNTGYIQREQVRFYTGLADYLLTLK